MIDHRCSNCKMHDVDNRGIVICQLTGRYGHEKNPWPDFPCSVWEYDLTPERDHVRFDDMRKRRI